MRLCCPIVFPCRQQVFFGADRLCLEWFVLFHYQVIVSRYSSSQRDLPDIYYNFCVHKKILTSLVLVYLLAGSQPPGVHALKSKMQLFHSLKYL